MTELSNKTSEIIVTLFTSSERNEVEELMMAECGDNIPFCEDYDQYQMERIRFAALKISEGKIDKLFEAIILAQNDWRDLLEKQSLRMILMHIKNGIQRTRKSTTQLLGFVKTLPSLRD